MADHDAAALPPPPASLASVAAEFPACYMRPVDYLASYSDGYGAGERLGFSSQRETPMTPIKPGETDPAKKTITLRVYDASGLPASGLGGEGAVCVLGPSEKQVSRNSAAYVDAAGAFAHVGDGSYRYAFTDAEVSAAGGEGSVLLRVRKDGFRTVVIDVPLRYGRADVLTADAIDAAAVKADAVAKIQSGLATASGIAAAVAQVTAAIPDPTTIRDAVLDALLADHAIPGSVADGVAIAAGLLQGNFMQDNVVNGPNGQTSARLRIWRSAGAMPASPGGSGAEGAFAVFSATTAYAGPGKVTVHRVERIA